MNAWCWSQLLLSSLRLLLGLYFKTWIFLSTFKLWERHVQPRSHTLSNWWNWFRLFLKFQNNLWYERRSRDLESFSIPFEMKPAEYESWMWLHLKFEKMVRLYQFPYPNTHTVGIWYTTGDHLEGNWASWMAGNVGKERKKRREFTV